MNKDFIIIVLIIIFLLFTFSGKDEEIDSDIIIPFEPPDESREGTNIIEVTTKIIYYKEGTGIIQPSALPTNLKTDLSAPYFGKMDLESGYPNFIQNKPVSVWEKPSIAEYGGEPNSLNTDVPINVKEVLLFDADEFIALPAVTITGNQIITFNLWLDNYDEPNNQILYFVPVGNDRLIIKFQFNKLLVFVSDIGGNSRAYTLDDSYLKQILYIEISKGVQSINYVRINGITLSGVVAATGGAVGNFFGRLAFGLLPFLKFAAIWNIEVALSHNWLGHPAGNVNAAWVDNIGIANGVVNGILPQTSNLPR
jgi:hypothetical protein